MTAQTTEKKQKTLTLPAKKKAADSSERRESTNGTIVRITDDKVHCELYLPTSNVVVALSPEHFGLLPVRPGMPIHLLLKEEEGVDKLIITERSAEAST